MTMCLLCRNVSQRDEVDWDAYPRQSEKVCIRMRATLRTVDFVEMLQRELELGCKCLDTSTELAFREGRELVEKRLNYRRVKDDHRKLKDKSGEEVSHGDKMGVGGGSQKHHDPGYETVTGPLEDIEEGSKNGSTNSYAESPAFQHVRKVQRRGGLVETMLLLEDEGFV